MPLLGGVRGERPATMLRTVTIDQKTYAEVWGRQAGICRDDSKRSRLVPRPTCKTSQVHLFAVPLSAYCVGVAGTISPIGPAGPIDPGSPLGPAGPAGPLGPATPGSPFGPAGPTGPTSPLGPTGPVSPLGPAGPVGPAFPFGPIGPESPLGPAGPTGPVLPAGPTGPVSPTGPAGPAAPASPFGPAGPTSPLGPAGPASNWTASMSEDLAPPKAFTIVPPVMLFQISNKMKKIRAPTKPGSTRPTHQSRSMATSRLEQPVTTRLPMHISLLSDPPTASSRSARDSIVGCCSRLRGYRVMRGPDPRKMRRFRSR